MSIRSYIARLRCSVSRNLSLLWLGQTISMAGDSVYGKALVWLMLDLTNSSSITGLVALSAYLPTLLVGVWAGTVVDRHNHRNVMLMADGARAMLVLLVPLLFGLGYLTPTILFGITFLVATGSAFFNPARDALVPFLTPDRTQLLKANAIIQSSWMFALLVGPGIAMVLLSLLQIRTSDLFLFDAASYVVSFACIAMIVLPRPVANESFRGTSLRQSAFEGLRYAFRNRCVRGLLLITAADNLLIMGPAGLGMAVFVRSELGQGIGTLMLIEACYAVGMIVGTFALPVWNRRFGYGQILLIGMVLDGLTFLPLLWVRSTWGTALTIVVHSMAIPLLVVPRPSLVQHIVPTRLQGRVFSMIGVTVVGFTALSTGLTGIVTEWVSMPFIYGFISVAAALVGVWGWTIRELRDSDLSADRHIADQDEV